MGDFRMADIAVRAGEPAALADDLAGVDVTNTAGRQRVGAGGGKDRLARNGRPRALDAKRADGADSLFCQLQLSALELDDPRKPSNYRDGPRPVVHTCGDGVDAATRHDEPLPPWNMASKSMSYDYGLGIVISSQEKYRYAQQTPHRRHAQ